MRKATAIVLASALLLTSGAALGGQHEEKAAAGGSAVSCDQIEAAWDEGGGNVSEDMLAKKLNVSVERVKDCLHEEAMELKKDDNPPASK